MASEGQNYVQLSSVHLSYYLCHAEDVGVVTICQ